MGSSTSVVLSLVSLATLSALVSHGGIINPPPPPKPNILLIVLDDVGTDKLEEYDVSGTTTFAGSPLCAGTSTCNDASLPLPFPKTPNLDNLMKGNFGGLSGGGIRFNRAYTASVCGPSRACMLTGRYGFRTGMGSVDTEPHGQHERLANTEVLIPEVLRNGIPQASKKYQCGAFGKWHLSAKHVCDPAAPSDYTHPIDNGFEFFKGTMDNLGDHFSWVQVTATATSLAMTSYFKLDPAPPPLSCDSNCAGMPCNFVFSNEFDETLFSASVTRNDALTWINAQDSARPWFAYVAFNAPHATYQVPPWGLLSPETQALLQANCDGDYDAGKTVAAPCEATKRKLFYNAMLEAVDTEIGALISGIAPTKKLNTLVFVIGDNGTPGAVMELGIYPGGDTHDKGTAYELGVRVPLLVAGVTVPTGYHISEAPVHAVDLWRTIAQIAGADEPPGLISDSISFKNVILNPSSLGSRTQIFCQQFTTFGPYVPNIDPTPCPAHDRCIIEDFDSPFPHGRFKLIRKSPATCDLPFTEELYELPNESASANKIGDPGFASVLLQLQNDMTNLSGP